MARVGYPAGAGGGSGGAPAAAATTTWTLCAGVFQFHTGRRAGSMRVCMTRRTRFCFLEGFLFGGGRDGSGNIAVSTVGSIAVSTGGSAACVYRYTMAAVVVVDPAFTHGCKSTGGSSSVPRRR